jgi:hypothetical protein
MLVVMALGGNALLRRGDDGPHLPAQDRVSLIERADPRVTKPRSITAMIRRR